MMKAIETADNRQVVDSNHPILQHITYDGTIAIDTHLLKISPKLTISRLLMCPAKSVILDLYSSSSGLAAAGPGLDSSRPSDTEAIEAGAPAPDVARAAEMPALAMEPVASWALGMPSDAVATDGVWTIDPEPGAVKLGTSPGTVALPLAPRPAPVLLVGGVAAIAPGKEKPAGGCWMAAGVGTAAAAAAAVDSGGIAVGAKLPVTPADPTGLCWPWDVEVPVPAAAGTCGATPRMAVAGAGAAAGLGVVVGVMPAGLAGFMFCRAPG